MPRTDEFGLIAEFVKPFKKVPPPRGPGDDCAVLEPTERALCLKTDAVIEGVHFTRKTFSLEDVGHKALAVNLSDLAAAGAEPSWALCALGLPAGTTAKDVRAIGRGMASLANACGLDLVGGNVSRADVLSVTVSVGGLVPEDRVALGRGGAKPGDVLVVTGGLGEAAAGLAVLAATGGRPRSSNEKKLARAQRRPEPHLAAGLVLGEYASACIDVSDGLVQDVGHLCERSKVGAALDTRRFPVSEALLSWAGSRAKAAASMLTGGEDYVLVAAVPEPRVTSLLRAMAKEALVAVPIGEVTRGAKVVVDGRPWAGKGGYRHFE